MMTAGFMKMWREMYVNSRWAYAEFFAYAHL